jgi:hypothetical protein
MKKNRLNEACRVITKRHMKLWSSMSVEDRRAVGSTLNLQTMIWKSGIGRRRRGSSADIVGGRKNRPIRGSLEARDQVIQRDKASRSRNEARYYLVMLILSQMALRGKLWRGKAALIAKLNVLERVRLSK